MSKSQIEVLIKQKISANGFSTSDIHLDTELLSAGYLDSLDVAEILYQIERIAPAQLPIPSSFHEKEITISLFASLIDR